MIFVVYVQGGGLRISGGTTTLTNCYVTSNSAVRMMIERRFRNAIGQWRRDQYCLKHMTNVIVFCFCFVFCVSVCKYCVVFGFAFEA